METRLTSGTAPAFAEFVEQYKPRAFRWAMGMVTDGDEAEDVVQDAFVIAYRKFGSIRAEGPVDAWLYSVVRRAAIRRTGKQKRRKLLGDSPRARPTLEVYLTDPGARIDRESAVALIRESALELPLRQREIFDLCDLQGHEPAEVAELLGLNPVSVRGNLFKARASVRRRILMMHPRYAEQMR